MSKYGYCPNCGSVMNSPSVCSNCDEEAVIAMQDDFKPKGDN